MIKTNFFATENNENDFELGENYSKNSPSLSTLHVPKKTICSVAGYRKVEENKTKAEMVILTSKTCGNVNIASVTKLKIYNKSEKEDHFILKLETDNETTIWHMPSSECINVAVYIIWSKVQSFHAPLSPQDSFLNTCEGEVLRKGHLVPQWKDRRLLITLKDGLSAFKPEEESPSLRVEKTEELWTRFEMIENKHYIVFKIWDSIFKEEFAVPINKAAKWFNAFSSLLDR